MPQSVGDVVKASAIEASSSVPEETISSLGKAVAISSTNWETASDPGAGGSFRKGKKAVSGAPNESSPMFAGTDTLPVPPSTTKGGGETGGAISHSSSTASVSTASSAQHVLLNSALDSESGSGLQHTNSSVSLPGFWLPQPASPPDDAANGGTSINGKGKKSKEGAFKTLQTYLSPTYADQDTEFHRLFDPAAVDPPLDRLVFVSACAVNRELLYSGRVYISQRYICFYSGLFKTLQIVIPFGEITKLRKEKVLRMMPTAIEIVKRDGEKHLFIHVSQRDLVFQVMFELWQNHRSGVLLSSGQLDQKIRQLFGQQTASGSPSTAAVDIRWRYGSNDDDSVDFLQNSATDTPKEDSALGAAFSFHTASTASNSTANSVGIDDDIANVDDLNKDGQTQETVDGASERDGSSRQNGTLKPNSVNNISGGDRPRTPDLGSDTQHRHTPSGKPVAEAVMRAAVAVGTAIVLPDGSGSPRTEPRMRHREKEIEDAAKHQMVHSGSVQGVENEGASHMKLGRCRSRSISGERPSTSPPRSPDAQGSKKTTTSTSAAAHEPTPTPTPSPSPTAMARNEPVVVPSSPIPSIFLNVTGYPPASFAPCQQHQHLKRCVFDEEIPLAPELLSALLWGPGESFNDLCKRHGALKFEYSAWEPPMPKPDVASMQRGEIPPPLGFTSVSQGNYRLQLGWAVGPRYADLIEKHTMYPETRPGVFYVTERESYAPGMPYGNDFFTIWRYCIRRLPARQPGEKIVRSQLTVTGEVRYRKSIWRAFQGMIERNAQTGVESFIAVLRAALVEECATYAATATAAVIPTTPSSSLSETPSRPSLVARPSAIGEPRGQATASAIPATPTAVSSSTTQRRLLSSYQDAPPDEDAVPPSYRQRTPSTPLGGGAFPPPLPNTGTMPAPMFNRIDQWLAAHPQLAARTLLAAVVVLLVFTFVLARRVSEVEEHLLRVGMPGHAYHAPLYYDQAPTGGRASPVFQTSPELGSVLKQLSQVAGQLSESLGTLAEAIRSQQLSRQTGGTGGGSSNAPPGGQSKPEA